MSGVNEIELKYRKKITNIVQDNDILKHYVNFLGSLSYRTKYTYVCTVAAFLRSIKKNEKKLEFDDFNDYLSDFKYIKDMETKTASYMITVYSALKKFSEYLFVSKKIQENYMLNIKRPKAIEKQSTIQKRSNGYLTKNEIHKVVEHIYFDPSDKRSLSDKWKVRNCAIIYLFLFTGMRCSALSSIDIDDIDFNEKTLMVTDKGYKVRKYDMPNELISVITDWLKERKKIDGVNCQALFISNRKTRMSNQAISLMVQSYMKMSGINNKHITPHKLRATYGTQLYNSSKDINFVRDCMGHESVETTKLYIRGNNENAKRASDIMSSII